MESGFHQGKYYSGRSEWECFPSRQFQTSHRYNSQALTGNLCSERRLIRRFLFFRAAAQLNYICNNEGILAAFMKNLLLIAVGGGIGSMARYLGQKWIAQLYVQPFPLGTLMVNITGCFLIGLFYALSEKGNLLTPEWRLLLTTGFCGGFTTFSTFAYENVSLIKSGDLMYVLLYILLSVTIGIIAVYVGILFIKIF